MNVEQARILLDGLPNTMEVLVASDEEWNKLRPLYAADESYIVNGESVHSEDVLAGEYEGEEIKKAVILWG